jgi:hypothetical protein
MKLKHLTFLLIIVLFACEDDSENKEPAPIRYLEYVFDDVQVTRDIKYGENMDQSGTVVDLLVDIYEPLGDTETTRPLAIIAHGGNFFGGDKADMALIAADLALSGYVVASISYRLLEQKDPILYSEEELLQAVIEAVHDMKAAVRFFNKDFQTINNYRIDPENIFIGGYSAGAVTSLHYGYLNDLNEAQEAGQFLVDYLNLNGGFEGNSGNPGFSSEVKGVFNIAGALLKAEWVDAGEPFLYSIHGTDDTVVPYLSGNSGGTIIVTEGSGLIHQEAEREGILNELNAIPGGGHDAILSCFSCLGDARKFLCETLP